MPFADFAPLAQKEGSFDFVHLKDWTFVDMKPRGQPFVFSNMKLIGGPPGCCPAGQVCSSSTPSPTDTTILSGSTRTAGQGLTVILGTLGFIYLVFAI